MIYSHVQIHGYALHTILGQEMLEEVSLFPWKSNCSNTIINECKVNLQIIELACKNLV